MKRTILFGLLVVSMSLSATAIYDPNNTVTSPGEKTQGDLKATQLDSRAEIPDYSLDFMHMDGRCGVADADNASIRPRDVSPGNNTVVVEGVFQTSHPNYNLTANVEKDGRKYILRVKGVETSEVAPRCIGNVNYHAHFSAPQNATLTVHHNQTEITEEKIQKAVNKGKKDSDTGLKEPPESETSESETGQKPIGFFAGVLNSLESII